MFNCMNCTAVIDALAVVAVRGVVLCPKCRVIEKEMNQITLKLVTENKALSLAREMKACNCVIQRKRRLIDNYKERLAELDVDFRMRILEEANAPRFENL